MIARFMIATCAFVIGSSVCGLAAQFFPAAPSPAWCAANPGISVVDVRCHGAWPDDGLDDSAAIQSAADSVPAAGGILFFPAGRFDLSGGIQVRSGTIIQGQGSGSLLRVVDGLSGSINGMIIATDQHHIQVRDISFDLNAAGNFGTVVKFDSTVPGQQVEGLIVERCTFTNATASPPGETWTLHAVLASRARDVWIRDNRIAGLQLKLAGGGGTHGPGIFVLDNHIERSPQWGISFVAITDGAILTDCLISGNVIRQPHSGGIYFGSDTDVPGVSVACHRIHVLDNTILGPYTEPTANHKAIQGRIPAEASDWLIRGNTAADAGPLRSNSFGIFVGPRQPGGILRRLEVSSNRVSGADRAGIHVQGAEGFSIEGNQLRRCRGIELIGPGTAAGIVEANLIDGAVTEGSGAEGASAAFAVGIAILDAGPVTIRGNILRNHSDEHLRFETTPAGRVEALVESNRCWNDSPPMGSMRAVRELGSGAFAMQYVDNEFGANIPGAFALIGSPLVRRDNRGDASPHAVLARHLSVVATLDFDLSVATSQDLPVSVPGASPGDPVLIGAASAATGSGAVYFGWVPAQDSVTVRSIRTGPSFDAPAATFRVTVLGY